MDARERKGGQQKTRFSSIRRAGHVARTICCRFLSDRILAFGELGTLGVHPRLPGPALEGHS